MAAYADAAFTVPAESSTSSVQHERQSFTRLGSLTISSNLLHFEQTSVSVKPSSRHPVVAGAACTKAASRSTSAPNRAWDAFCQTSSQATSIQIARAGTRHAQIPVVPWHLSAHNVLCRPALPYLLALYHGTPKFWKLKKINQRSFSPFFYSVEKLSSFVGESVILSFYACLVNKRPRISSQPRHCTADVSIQLHNLLDTARVKKRRCNPLLYYKHDTFSSLYSDGGRSKLDNDKNRTFGKYFSVISEQERRAST